MCFFRTHKGGRRAISVLFRAAYTAVPHRPHGEMHTIRTAIVQTEDLDAILKYYLPTQRLYYFITDYLLYYIIYLFIYHHCNTNFEFR